MAEIEIAEDAEIEPLGEGGYMHDDVERILRYFEYGHLSNELQEVSRPFYELAHELATMDAGLTNSNELLVALRKLLEAKDAAVRAALDRP